MITRQALDQACDQAEKFARAFIDSQKGKAYFTKLALERVMEDQKQGKIDDNKRMVQLQFSILRAKQQVKFDVRAAGTCKWWGLDAPRLYLLRWPTWVCVDLAGAARAVGGPEGYAHAPVQHQARDVAASAGDRDGRVAHPANAVRTRGA